MQGPEMDLSPSMRWILAAGCVFFLAGVAVAEAAQSLSFGEAMKRLEADSHVLDAARRELASARGALAQAQARRWPTLKLEGRVTRLNDPLTVGLGDIVPDLTGLLPPGLVPDGYEIQSEQFYNL